jgi:outer membrane protein assembly factor BamD
MNVFRYSSSLRSILFFCVVAIVSAAGCAAKKDAMPPGTSEPDKFLFEKGTDALDRKKWLTAREFFTRIVDNYPQSPYRPDAKLGVGDAYLGEGTLEAYVLAINEFKEFLTFYPTNPRADYAQYKLGYAHYKQMRGPQRDQSETREAVRELETFVEKYPNSQLLPEVQQKLRESRDRLSTSEYNVGFFYFRQKWYPGAIDRFKSLLKSDPGFSSRDAVYYYLAESLLKVKLDAEALPYLDRLVKEFETSEYLEKAKARIDEFKATPAAPAPAASNPPPAVTTQPAPTAPATPAGGSTPVVTPATAGTPAAPPPPQ